METATYRIIETFPEVEYYIRNEPISKSNLDLSDEIREKFRVKVSSQTIANYRKKLPQRRIKDLYEAKKENIANLQFIIDILKEQLEQIEDSRLKLRYSQEIIRYVREINLIIDDEIKYQKNF